MPSVNKVYVLRFQTTAWGEILKNPAILRAPSRYAPEMRKDSKGFPYSTGCAVVRVVMNGDPPPDNADATWTLAGTTANPASPTYIPPDRCKRGHPPLRYLSNGGCVYCVKGRADAPRGRLVVQIPHDVDVDAAVGLMGWSISERARRLDRWVVRLDLGTTAATDAMLMCRAMGWEVVV